MTNSSARRVYDTVLRLPLKVGNRTDGLQPLRDLDSVRSFLSGAGPTALFDLPWLPIYLAICFAFHPYIGLTALAGAVILGILTLMTELMTREPTRAATGFAMTRTSLAEAGRRNAEALRAMGMARPSAAQWSEANRKYMMSQQRASDVAGGFGSMSRVLRMMLQSCVLAVGAYLVINQQATAGIIIAGSILGARALAPVDLAIGNWKGFVAARQSWERLTRLLAMFPEQKMPMALQPPAKSLAVETVAAVPPGTERVVVQDVSFALQSGHGLGIIGPSGSGKSSLARLLIGVWEPARGRVRLDGASLDQWSPDALGPHIGYLPQDVELMAGTVAQNIARFASPLDAEAVIAAATAAGVHSLIVGLPEGYETPVGESGSGLSAGQAQRIALARALYGDPFLVVLDEPNSNLDAEGDEALSHAIMGVRARGGIVVVVAHRPSAIASVDQLLMMNQGRAQGFGPKEEILAKRHAAGRRRAAAPQGGARDRECQVMSVPAASPSRRAIRRHCLAGLVIVAILAGGVGGWASTMKLSGALIAPGQVVVDSNVKKVQHPTGGIVGELRARDGDRVKVGDVVVRLDDTVTRANLAIVNKGINELTARKARLESERDGAEKISFPADLLARTHDPDAVSAIDSERKLFELRRHARVGQKDQLRQRIGQFGEEVRGLKAQQNAKHKEIELIEREMVGVRDLWKQKLVSIARLTELERNAARLEGEGAQLIAQAAQVGGKISETELQIIQIDRDLSSEVAKEMREIDGKLGEFVERKVTAEDQLKRIDIRAPQDGTIFQSTVHTVGGVITAGDPIMMVVPDADNLTVEAKVNPQDIDQVKIGQTALLRLSAFNMQTTPEILGTVNRISADAANDQKTGVSYYIIRVAMPPEEVAKLGGVTVIPGMPVEAFVQTGERTMLSYFMKPFRDQMMRVFRGR